MRRFEPVLVLLGYVACSLALIGRHLLRAPQDAVVGSFGGDQGFFAWSLVHWLEVLQQRQSPFLTDRIDAPMGFNLAWATTIPGPAILAAPLTALIGPLATYNTLALAAPALAAWAAYLLCRHLTDELLAAILGGWTFGFSSYVLGETLNHLNLALVATLPLILLVAIRLIEESLPRVRATLLLAGLIALQFLIFTEVAATATLVGGVALVAACVLGPSDSRIRIGRALPWLASAYAVALVIVSPLLIAAFRHPNPLTDRIRPELYPLDFKNLLVPTPITWLGGERYLATSAAFAGNLTEQLAYVGPLLAVVALAGLLRWRRERLAWTIGATGLAALALAAGSHLVSGGVPSLTMPWSLVGRLPLIGYALPTRIVVFTWLAIALLTSLFVARAGGSARGWLLRAALAVAALALLLPAPNASWWRTGLATPAGISSGSATAAIPDDAVVLLLPYSFRGNGMYWQALDRMRYRQAGGYSAAAVPAAYAGFPIVAGFYSDQLPANARYELLRYLAFTGTSWVLVDGAAPGPWTGLLREAGGKRSDVGGVVRFRFDPETVRAEVAPS